MKVPLGRLVKPGDTAIKPLKDIESGPTEFVVYFAYGSNMSTARLRERTPSCKPIGIATLPNHALRFDKHSVDGSGKCNALATEDGQSVIGVLFSFDPAERAALDKAGGVGSGYEHASVTVINEKGRRRKVLTYLATPDYIDESLRPYGWHKEFVLSGAKEHGLPPDYVAKYIESVQEVDDPDNTREMKHRATLAIPNR